jgi:hypothetical protein
MNAAKEKYMEIVIAQEEEEKILNSKKEELKKKQEQNRLYEVRKKNNFIANKNYIFLIKNIIIGSPYSRNRYSL